MYHCHMCFYFIGSQSRLFEVIREMSPFDSFAHEFMESESPKQELVEKADVIFADLQETDAMMLVNILTD